MAEPFHFDAAENTRIYGAQRATPPASTTGACNKRASLLYRAFFDRILSLKYNLLILFIFLFKDSKSIPAPEEPATGNESPTACAGCFVADFVIAADQNIFPTYGSNR
ncbi:MAG: hypothetical protein KIT18_03375 [Burkholderiales bacterium]|nr:hypothetical protein [Burkholderiales bacterium]